MDTNTNVPGLAASPAVRDTLKLAGSERLSFSLVRCGRQALCEAAARFYTGTFPDSKVTAIHNAPGDYPSGKEGDVLTVEFTVLGIPCLGLNGGPAFRHSEAFSFQIATDSQEETDRYWDAIVGNGGMENRARLVQGPLGPLLADHPARANRGACGWRR
jgi:predicted 3-demethylubiquinone-9 3-methyltransferase (glyoxalase superfamily)